VASVHVRRVVLASGAVRYRVRYRLGGRETSHRLAGSFTRRKEAEARARWVAGELAAMRTPDLRSLAEREPRTLAGAAADWQASRIDIAENTARVHRKSLVHVLAAFGDREPASIAPAEVGAWVGGLAGRYTPGYVRKIVDALAMVLDHEGITPNPARDRRVRLPRAVLEEIRPPSAEDVEGVLGAVAPRYRLVVVVLDATGMRVGELEASLRTEIARACKATGTPLWSPHDLRHRRISLWHRQGVSWAQIGEWAGQRDLATTANRYTHVVVGREIDHAAFVRSSAAGVGSPVGSRRRKSAPFAG
jgi:integrase